MGLKDKLTKADAMNLKMIQKKLKLPFKKLRLASSLERDTTLTDDEKVRILLDIPDGVTTYDFLTSRLNENEIITMGKFMSLDGIVGFNGESGLKEN